VTELDEEVRHDRDQPRLLVLVWARARPGRGVPVSVPVLSGDNTIMIRVPRTAIAAVG